MATEQAAAVIVDTGGANLASLQHALTRIGANSQVTRDRATISRASHVILPGVGAAGDAMNSIRESGLSEVIKELSQPVLGICLGMHLLGGNSEEDQVTCLGIVETPVTRLPAEASRPVPHMGWNQIDPVMDCPLLQGLGRDTFFYFVHSYVMPIDTFTSSTFSYGENYCATLSHRNFFATQFHPERSAAAGSRLLKNFLDLRS